MATPWWAGHASLEGCPFFESASHKWCYFSDSQDSRVQESEVVMGTAWLTHHYAWGPTRKVFAFSSHELMLCWPSVPEGEMLLPGDTTIIHLKRVKMATGHLGVLIPLNQQAKREGGTVPVGDGSWVPGRLGCCSLKEARQSVSGVQGAPGHQHA